jgi:POT family proton-dependent oligopeptide transporter
MLPTTIAPGPSGASGKDVLGQPASLFLLFMAEMWERFSFYGMKALLLFYMTKKFLQYDDARAYGVLGAYGALVYATPFIGGLLADRLLGQRHAVIFGGILMAIGHLLMTVEQEAVFLAALAFLIVGNGFFKPNISTMVGGLYRAGDPRRDGGFTLFYMGINLGAALAPLLCGAIGQAFGYHYGFGLATIGMLVGVAVFVAPGSVAAILILLTASSTAGLMAWLGREEPLLLAINAPVAIALLSAAVIAARAGFSSGLEPSLGRPTEASLSRPGRGLRIAAVYAGTLLCVPGFAMLVGAPKAATVVLAVLGGIALASLVGTAVRSDRVTRDRMCVILFLMVVSMLFWAFFEQGSSSIANFTDRNVDRVINDEPVVPGRAYEEVAVTQEFVGVDVAGRVWTLEAVEQATIARGSDDAGKREAGFVDFTATDAHAKAGLTVGGTELAASMFQAINPTCILLFAPIFSWIWGSLGRRGRDPSTPVKFALAMLQLSGGFVCLWWGASTADANGIVAMQWLILAYALHTTGELCLSPVGLSAMTKLAPATLVSTIMGAWFLASAFSHNLGGIVATMTAVEQQQGQLPAPIETVGIYGGVFGMIAVATAVAGLGVLALAPWMRRLSHPEVAGN